jgi:hypothetical protein
LPKGVSIASKATEPTTNKLIIQLIYSTNIDAIVLNPKYMGEYKSTIGGFMRDIHKLNFLKYTSMVFTIQFQEILMNKIGLSYVYNDHNSS